MRSTALAQSERLAFADGVLPAGRIGLARLAKFAFDGGDLRPLCGALLAKVGAGRATAGDVLDLALIAQFVGDPDLGRKLQSEALSLQRVFASPCSVARPRLRVLALAADAVMGSNMPIEFLLEDTDIALTTLYVIPGVALPDPLPEHDVAIVLPAQGEDTHETLAEIDRLARWPRPLLNAPGRIADLDRDRLHRVLDGIAGLSIPPTLRIARATLAGLAQSTVPAALDRRLDFPLTVRPAGSHGGQGLAKIDDRAGIAAFLSARPEAEFFVSRFVDYASAHDGLYRKYRIVVVDGTPFACHMAILDQWSIWYLNAAMKADAAKRAEEEAFMTGFEQGFGARHAAALAQMSARLGLDYFTIDCAEDRDGALLVFEADNAGIVHNMDPPEIFPYKPPQMRKIFAAFAAMLSKRAGFA